MAALDAEPEPADVHGGIDTDLAHAIRVLASITAGSQGERMGALAADEADEALQRSELLRRLEARAPSLVRGPLDRREQLWVSAGSKAPPAAAAVVPPGDTDRATAKPLRGGLFTSTAELGTWGMWWCYLELHRGSTLFPPPWTAWRLDVAPDARVREVASAADWAALLADVGRGSGGVLRPDWTAAAAEWDGVHVTLRAVAATQGFAVAVRAGAAAPAYWDVESTLWLRWRFGGVAELGSWDGGPAPQSPRPRLSAPGPHSQIAEHHGRRRSSKP
ncbi:MAG TPA: hypothetical protein VML35_09385 [Gaiellaceae bacterium]|nr:hypothetical protein [Gaiellaceae bacterium]